MFQRKIPPALLFLGCLLLFGLALYSPVLLGGKALYFRDIYHNYYTQLHFMRASLLQGEWPFWNPLLFAGTPPELQLTLWENKDALPRARFQYQSMAIKDPKVIPALLAESQGKSGIDFRQRVLLNEDVALERARAQVPSHEAREKWWRGPHFKRDKNNHLELALETNTSGYLVLADQHLPGWRAWDNQQETPILTANFFMRAIRVGPGKHQIVMRYEPPGFVSGCWISLISGLIWLGLLGLSYRSASAARTWAKG